MTFDDIRNAAFDLVQFIEIDRQGFEIRLGKSRP